MSELHQFARDFGITGIAAVLFLLFWRGSDKLGIVGFGKEYQKTRMAHERIAVASEQTTKDQGEIKKLLADLPDRINVGVREVFREVLEGVMRVSPVPPPPRPSVQPAGAPTGHPPTQARASRP